MRFRLVDMFWNYGMDRERTFAFPIAQPPAPYEGGNPAEFADMKVNFEVDAAGSCGPTIRLKIDGLRHPLLSFADARNLRYHGEETKNPRLRRAVSIVEEIFNDWVRDLPEEIRTHIGREDIGERITLAEWQHNGVDGKDTMMWLGEVKDFKTKFKFYEAGNELERRLVQNVDRIKEAIAADEGMDVSDPQDDIRRGFARALMTSADHPNLHIHDLQRRVAGFVAPGNDSVN